MNANKTVTGVNMYPMFDHLDVVRPQFESLVRMYEAGQITPVRRQDLLVRRRAGRASLPPRPQGARKAAAGPVIARRDIEVAIINMVEICASATGRC